MVETELERALNRFMPNLFPAFGIPDVILLAFSQFVSWGFLPVLYGSTPQVKCYVNMKRNRLRWE